MLKLNPKIQRIPFAGTPKQPILDSKGNPTSFQRKVVVVSKTPVEEKTRLPHEFNPPKRWSDQQDQKNFQSPFFINKLTPLNKVDATTRKWIRNASDERAAQEGYRFNERKGQFTVNWVEKNCVLYEGERGGYNIDVDDWQYEYFMQVFGWQVWSVKYGQWIRRFRTVSVWIPKKNAKSPTLAATGLYLLIGDGERGQKCYSVARDGGQALIAHQHAMEMVWASPILDRECKINATTGTIVHKPTRSQYKVVKGENKKSTEGFNGSLLVDETHVVDQELIDRIKRAGISRKEPLHIEASTAGDSIDGYGSNRYAYGQLVAKAIDANGEGHFNPRHYFLDFSVDQTIGLEKLSDPKIVVSIARRCNPTLGRIVEEEELMADWLESSQSVTGLRKFAMYRLNLWTAAGANWIEMQDWLDCGKQYTLKQLQQFPCLGGLDLSKTRDMTAFTLMFAVPHKKLGILPHTWTWLWWPEKTAAQYKAKINIHEMAINGKYPKEPYITLFKGKAINYKLLADHLDWVKDTFDLRGVGYDPYNSDELMRTLYSDYGWNEEMMVPIKQNHQWMGPPTKELERIILRKELRHNQNRILNWQFGHAVTESDKRSNYIVAKPEPNDYRKVDGIISLILSLCMFQNDESIRTAYSEAESILLYAAKSRDAYGPQDSHKREEAYREAIKQIAEILQTRG